MTTVPLQTLPLSAPAHGSATLWAVQWMRAAAAFMVVLGHSQSAVAQIAAQEGRSFARFPLPWGAGVDLFFVISGFIMVHASHQLVGRPGAALTFIKRRLIRIVPLYWLVTSLFLALLAAASLKGGDRFPDGLAILASYAFIPFDTMGIGHAFPVFDLGWTLNYEMLFYALFALSLGVARGDALKLALMLLLAAVAVGSFMPQHIIAPYVWTRPILANFALGMVVAMAASQRAMLSLLVRAALIVAGIAMLALDPMQVFAVTPGVTVANEWPRVIGAGLPASMVLAGAVLGPVRPSPAPLAILTRLGDMSYSLYLLHPFALILTEKLAQKSSAIRALPGPVLLAGTVAVAIGLAASGYRYVERPVTRRLNGWAFGPARATLPPLAPAGGQS